ncbi:MAG TPA: hypothetical protein VK595_05640, partial [Vicinamibacterales bacterium]|nr:hypothetical protein [Vicinamibacterales bacterium]
RAGTEDERRWTALLHDQLTGALQDALTSDGARASLRAHDERRRISRKGRSVTPPPIGLERGRP